MAGMSVRQDAVLTIRNKAMPPLCVRSACGSVPMMPTMPSAWADRHGPCIHSASTPSSAPTLGALLEVLIANRQMLVNVARGFVGCMSQAQDVVHDVSIKLVDFPNQESIRQALAYVTRMVRNASIDVCRRQRLELTYRADEEEGAEIASSAPSPEATLMAREALSQVDDALARMPPRTRDAFHRVKIGNETLQSTARALNVSQTLVHFMIKDAEQYCAACLDARSRGKPCPEFASGCARLR